MKTALITGGTKGIGKSVAMRLLAEGYNLVLIYLSDNKTACKTKDEFENLFPKSKINLLKVDCGNLQEIDIISQYLFNNDIYLDVLIFNTGLTCRSDFENITQENWQRVFNVNIHFPTFLLQAITKKIKYRGSIIFTGSLMGIYPHSLSLSYGVTKASVHALVKNLVKVFAPQEIRINAIAPGFVNTGWQKSKPESQKKNIRKKIALGRFCEPTELTDAYWFLITNTYVNGEILVVDGAYAMS
ncbi:SDR family NAD(P)-dependent oxidoreductase [Flavobacterium sp. DG2-3]|uniref:SDR family NAD(P)-dependent oxidoreductase n=1 Tax=Flavobacterium sp. DG2-3 TaxID=3068317 RepID=UPI00274023B8|nr:SDR family oxidoreductase [Flavobacterium sp. DG2-3]MDP5199627.1 SDR family oxidoreductase [Flavobacterium sp. DG2-3]